MTDPISPSLVRGASEAYLMASTMATALAHMDRADPDTQRLVGHIRDHVATAERLLDLTRPPLATEPYWSFITGQRNPTPFNDAAPLGGEG